MSQFSRLDHQPEISLRLVGTNKACVNFVAALLALISGVFTIKLCYEFGSSTVDKFLLCGAGLCFEIFKWASLVIGIALLKRGKNIGVLLITVSLVIVLVSLTATLGFLNSSHNSAASSALKNSTEYRLIEQQIESKVSQISDAQKNAHLDTENGFRSRAQRTLSSEIPRMERELQELQDRLHSASPDVETSANSLFESIARLTNGSPDRVKIVGYLVLSLLIEIVGALCIFLCIDADPIEEHIKLTHGLINSNSASINTSANTSSPTPPNGGNGGGPSGGKRSTERKNVVSSLLHRIFVEPKTASASVASASASAHPSASADAPVPYPARAEKPAKSTLSAGASASDRIQTDAPTASKRMHSDAPAGASANALAADADAHPSASVTALAQVKKRAASVAEKHGDQRDTGVVGDAGNRYRLIKKQIQDGQLKPSLRALQAAHSCGQSVAKNFLDQLVREGVLTKNDRGMYELSAVQSAQIYKINRDV